MTAVPKFAATDAQRARRRQLLQSAGPVGRMLLGDALGDAFGFGIEMQDAGRRCIESSKQLGAVGELVDISWVFYPFICRLVRAMHRGPECRKPK